MILSRKTNQVHTPKLEQDFYTAPAQELLARLETSLKGLSGEEAQARLDLYGVNELAVKKKWTVLRSILSKFLNPLVIVLVIIGSFSLFFGETISAAFVLLMVILSVLFSFVQEYRSSKAAEKLSRLTQVTATVFREGTRREIPIVEVVPGDIVDLSAGDIIPADLRLLSCKDMFINQSSLTGESFPMEKFSEPMPARAFAMTELNNIAFMGSSVVSGSGLGLVLKTGLGTQFGELTQRLALMHVESGFDKGIKSFTWLMIRFMSVMVLVIFVINALSKGNLAEAFLFALAVAVGLTPEMMPMLVIVNLSRGAIEMARKQVIVKRLNSIQNFGAMDVLCTDKTGTLTMDEIILEKYCNINGEKDDDVLRHAYLNSSYQTGLKNLLDRAILSHLELNMETYEKIDEIPFDFQRRLMSVVVSMDGIHRLITKGAHEEVLARCSYFELDGELIDIGNLFLPDLRLALEELGEEGFKVLAVAYRDISQTQTVYSRSDERDMVLKGYVAFLDPPKPSARAAIEDLRHLGVSIKVLTGDNEQVTRHICGEIGLDEQSLITGAQLDQVDDVELRRLVTDTTIFARLSPIQKERVIQALHANKHIVGFLGDGINDAPSLKAADIGITVNNAVDIAKESADIILLDKSLMVLRDGVAAGRKTFGNINKYIKMGASSNFGNMLSMLGASIFLPFLPMMPIQILLNNLLYDFSQVGVPYDNVDPEYLEQPRPWRVEMIQRFMLFIGPVSSLFDFITFGVLYFLFNARIENQALFQTGWLLESLCTQTLVIYVIRTAKIPFLESRPSRMLVLTSLVIVGLGLILPFTFLAIPFKFIPHSAPFVPSIVTASGPTR
jgi:P-type Mg2+ transporter